MTVFARQGTARAGRHIGRIGDDEIEFPLRAGEKVSPAKFDAARQAKPAHIALGHGQGGRRQVGRHDFGIGEGERAGSGDAA